MILKQNADGGSRPVPDPTVLTVEMQERATLALRDLLETRIAGMDKTIDVLSRHDERMPSVEVLARDLIALSEKYDERFKTIAVQIIDRDIALAAALAAAEKAVGVQNNNMLLANTKQELAIDKRIEGIGSILATTTKSFDDKIDGVKERVNSLEGIAKGVAGKSEGVGMSASIVLSLVGGLAGLAAIVGVILDIATRHP